MRVAAIILAVVLVLPPCSFAGNLEEAMESMFYSISVGGPSAYESQSRGGFVGGYLGAKTPTKSINVINFAAPRINAGCGGIDMFFGSFSFINAEELQQLLRSIAANAVGYAFKSAIQAMCPHCSAILNDLEAKINAINRSLKNSCAIANMLVEPFDPMAKKNKADEQGNLIKSAKNSVSDVFEAIRSLFSDSQSSVREDPVNNPNAANMVWKALWTTGVAGTIGDPDVPGIPHSASSVTMAQYLMSLTGTTIMPAEEDPDSGDCDSDEQCTVRAVTFGPILSFHSLVRGRDYDPNARYYKCEDGTDSPQACQRIGDAPFEFVGIEKWVDEELEDIVTRVGNGDPLSSDQQYLINIIPQPLLKYLIDVQNNTDQMRSIKNYVAKPFAHLLAVRLGEAIVQAAQNAFNGVDIASPPANYFDNIERLKQDINVYRISATEEMELLNELTSIVQTMREMQTSTVQ